MIRVIRSAARPSHSGDLRRAVPIIHSISISRNDRLRLRPYEAIRTKRARHRPLGVFTQRQAGNLENRRLLLYPYRISQNNSRIGHQFQKLKVPDRLHQTQIVHHIDATLARLPSNDDSCAGESGK